MKRKRELPVLLGAGLIAGTFGVLFWQEIRRPLRRAVEPKLRRNARNLTVAGLGAIALQASESPVAYRLTRLVERRSVGLLKIVGLPVWLEVAAAVILLDYSLYLWHVLTHKVPFLWRFHLVHHVDLDLDASTALRFHFAELVVSTAWRAGQIVVIGVSPVSLSVWQTLLFVSILFHHSNVRLSRRIERKLNWLIVTPRMHGIHHSTRREETDSNWSSGLSVWDRLHGTFRLDAPQKQVTIGVPAYRQPDEIAFRKLVKLPFERQKPSWQFSA